jgi:hypothetical protein
VSRVPTSAFRSAAALLLALVVGAILAPGAAGQGGSAQSSCVACHQGLEEMHPWDALSCTDCHGGNRLEPEMKNAHVSPRIGWPTDERVLRKGFDPAYVRFRNPSDLRIAETTCGACHKRDVEHVKKSLHGTTAGHLNDGLYENGLLDERESRYGIFSLDDPDYRQAEGALPGLEAIVKLRGNTRRDEIGDHFADLPRKNCMQCHLYSEGVGLRGRLGHDGLYRSSGCATCHVSYAEDGRSRSADESIDHFEPGHPLKHEMTAAPPTATCTHCHVGDAAVGNGFRGLAQLYPQMPAGPDVPNTTDTLIANQFFIKDPVLTPPDLHHAAGMDCIDCHTVRDVMGDGRIYGAMEHAVEIECISCHGTFDRYSDLRTSKGRRVQNLERRGDLFLLTSKRTGRSRPVKQVADILDPEHPNFNANAARAMTGEHAGLECYSCHAGWNTDFFGFHFDRNLGFTQLDTITGNRTDGRVNTQERVFATLRHFTLGVNPDGMVAPYLVGFSSMGTVHAEDGTIALDQALPETAAGMSGMSMIHHQLHTTQPVSRSCIECHRSPATWGLGTGDSNTSSFALARGLLVVVGERGVDTVLLDRENPDQSLYIARLPLGGARRVILDSDIVTGHASTAFVVIDNAGVALVDVRNPAFPVMRAFIAAGDARDVALAGDLLVIANGVGGVRLVDVADRSQPVLVSDLVTREARGVAVQWPRVLIADGPGGLMIADVSVPSRPRITGHVRIAPDGAQEDGDANAVAAIFQYGRPQGDEQRTPARMVAAVANGVFGLGIVDVTEPEAAFLLREAGGRYGGGQTAVDISFSSRFELGDTSGLRPTTERDVAYLLLNNPNGGGGATQVFDLTDPRRPALLSQTNIPAPNGPPAAAGARLVRSFNPPQLVTRVAVAGQAGLLFQEATQSEDVSNGAALGGLPGARDVAAEAFAFDRMLDETGRQLKDISHANSRYFDPAEIFRMLTVPGEALGSVGSGGDARAEVAAAFGEAARPGGMAEASRSLALLAGGYSEEMLARLDGGFRIAPQEDLARLVRHTHPPDFDRNGDEALSRGELEQLIFSVLDANRDDTLDKLEWPRHPAEDLGKMDKDKDGEISRQEMDLGDDVMRFFDTDGDKLARFGEWPWVVDVDPLPTFYYVSFENLKKLVNRLGWDRKRPRLYQLIARGEVPHDVTDEMIQFQIDVARGGPLADPTGETAAPGFISRWDLDGDGAVEPEEYGPYQRIAARCDTNDDGRIDRKDMPE